MFQWILYCHASFLKLGDILHTAWKYGAFSNPYFPVFSPKYGKYGPGKTLYLDTFHSVTLLSPS